MRRAMICVSFMLAIVQLWPMIFGHVEGGSPVVEARLVPAAQAAVMTKPVTMPARIPLRKLSMPTCYQRYERAFASCAPGNASCQLRVGDNWDVCEATGFWPE